MKLEERLKNLMDSELDSMGYELVKMDLSSRGRRRVLRIFMDNPPHNVSIDDCVKVARALELVLENEMVFDGPYNLEVSSPGINRPLSKPEHFNRFKGRRVKVYVRDESGKRHGHVGTISEAGENEFILSSRAGERRIPYRVMEEANLYGEKWKVPKRKKERGTGREKGNIFDSGGLVN